MSDGDDSALSELAANGLLDTRVRFHVNAGCGLINTDDSCSSEQSTSQTEQLSLTHGEDTPPLLHILI